jgi:hypothetical protein
VNYFIVGPDSEALRLVFKPAEKSTVVSTSARHSGKPTRFGLGESVCDFKQAAAKLAFHSAI